MWQDKIKNHYLPEKLRVDGEYHYYRHFDCVNLYIKEHDSTSVHFRNSDGKHNLIFGKYREMCFTIKLLPDYYWIIFAYSTKNNIKRQSKFYFLVDDYEGLTQFFEGLEKLNTLKWW
jgi:hypothetical protein